MTKKRKVRNVLSFRDYDIDEDDFHFISNMLSTQGGVLQGNGVVVHTVRDAIEQEFITISDEDNKDKRVTEIGDLELFKNYQIPDDISKLDALRDIVIQQEGVKKPQFLPHDFCTIRSLHSVTLWDFNLRSLPEEIDQLKNLEDITIYENESISLLPNSIMKLPKLKNLILLGCCNLRTLPDLGKSLEGIIVTDCKNFKSLPISMKKCTNLKVLELYNCQNLSMDHVTLEEIIMNLDNLEKLSLDYQCFSRFHSSAFTNSNKNLVELEIMNGNSEVCVNLPIIQSVRKINVEGLKMPINWLSSFSNLQECYIERDINNPINDYSQRDINNRINNLELGHFSSFCDLQHLEKLKVSSCKIDIGHGLLSLNENQTFPSLRILDLFSCSGQFNIGKCNMPCLETLKLSGFVPTSDTNHDEVDNNDQSDDDDRDDDDSSVRVFAIDYVIGHKPNLKNITINFWENGITNVLQISPRFADLFPVCKKIVFKCCTVEFVYSPKSTILTADQFRNLTFPKIEELELLDVSFRFTGLGMLSTASDSFRNLTLPSLKSVQVCDNLDLTNEPFEKLMAHVLSSSPNVSSMDFSGCGIDRIPQNIIQRMPKNLKQFNLSKNPIFRSATGTDDIVNLLNTCKLLSYVGRRDTLEFGCRTGEEYVYPQHEKRLGYLSSINNANALILMSGRGRCPYVPLALWPYILENASVAFKKSLKRKSLYDREDDAKIETEHDSIYILLRRRAAQEVFAKEKVVQKRGQFLPGSFGMVEAEKVQNTKRKRTC